MLKSSHFWLNSAQFPQVSLDIPPLTRFPLPPASPTKPFVFLPAIRGLVVLDVGVSGGSEGRVMHGQGLWGPRSDQTGQGATRGRPGAGKPAPAPPGPSASPGGRSQAARSLQPPLAPAGRSAVEEPRCPRAGPEDVRLAAAPALGAAPRGCGGGLRQDLPAPHPARPRRQVLAGLGPAGQQGRLSPRGAHRRLRGLGLLSLRDHGCCGHRRGRRGPWAALPAGKRSSQSHLQSLVRREPV